MNHVQCLEHVSRRSAFFRSRVNGRSALVPAVCKTLHLYAMAISAKEILKNHTDKERFGAVSSCIDIVTLGSFPAQTITCKSPLPFPYIMLVIFKLISSIRMLRQSVQHTAKSLWNTLFVNF